MTSQPIQDVIVLGSGSAGLLSAITFKQINPELNVTIVRDPDIGVIGVGEGTTPIFPKFLFDYLKISRSTFYNTAAPTWKLGIRFEWGPRDHFNYSFSNQLDNHWPGMKRPIGYYCDDEFSDLDIPSALMSQGKVFTQNSSGVPQVHPWHAFHIENKTFVAAMEAIVDALGIEVVDARIESASRGPRGISSLLSVDGREFTGDFFIDASGFRKQLIGKELNEPFVSYQDALFCDRAVVGGWTRGADEPILPYTTAETMDSGWAWQIEHEQIVNRGYVYCSDEISDDEAFAEFKRKNPKIPDQPRIVKFDSGRVRRQWVDNVVAVGNAAGFVEPLEATAIMLICQELRVLMDMLRYNDFVHTPSLQQLYNQMFAESWDDVRDFLALHYILNTRLDTPFWQRARNETALGGLEELLDFYRANGPNGFMRNTLRNVESDFGLEGYLVMLVGMQAPYDLDKHQPSQQEQNLLQTKRSSSRRWLARE